MAETSNQIQYPKNESEAELDAFAEAVLADESLQERLSEAKTPEDVKAAAKEAGFNFDVIVMAGKLMIASHAGRRSAWRQLAMEWVDSEEYNKKHDIVSADRVVDGTGDVSLF